MKKTLHSTLTTFTSLFIASVALTALLTLSSYLNYGKTISMNDEIVSLREDLRDIQYRGLAREAVKSSQTVDMRATQAMVSLEARLVELETNLTEKDVSIGDLKARLSAERKRTMDLGLRLNEIRASGPAGPVKRIVSDPPVPGNTPEDGAPPTLSEIQQKIRLMPPIGTVKKYDVENAFVVIDAGIDFGVAKDQIYALRQNDDIVARVKVTIAEKEQSVAEIVPGSVLSGRRPAEGDEVIDIPTL